MKAKFWVQKDLVQNNLGQDKNQVPKNVGPKKFGSKRIMGQQNFGFTKFLLRKKFWVQIFLNFVSKNICRSKKDSVKQNLVQKF